MSLCAAGFDESHPRIAEQMRSKLCVLIDSWRLRRTPPAVRVHRILDKNHFLRQAKQGGEADTVLAARSFR